MKKHKIKLTIYTVDELHPHDVNKAIKSLNQYYFDLESMTSTTVAGREQKAIEKLKELEDWGF